MHDYAADQAAASTLATRILCDHLPRHMQAGYVFAETTENQPSPVLRIAMLYREKRLARVLAYDGHTENGYGGLDFVADALVAEGVDRNAIFAVPQAVREGKEFNTLTEAIDLICFCADRRIDHLCISAAPFHQVRAFITCASVAIQTLPGLNTYSTPGTVLPWNAVVRHSQGVLKDTRTNLIRGEWERLARYRDQGTLASHQQIMTYLDGRK